jgi:hypothetical protein
MYVDVYIPAPMSLERQDVEDAITDVLGERGEIVGAGSGPSMVNVDIEIFDTAQSGNLLKEIAETLHWLGLPLDTVLKATDPGRQMTVAEIVL